MSTAQQHWPDGTLPGHCLTRSRLLYRPSAGPNRLATSDTHRPQPAPTDNNSRVTDTEQSIAPRPVTAAA